MVFPLWPRNDLDLKRTENCTRRASVEVVGASTGASSNFNGGERPQSDTRLCKDLYLLCSQAAAAAAACFFPDAAGFFLRRTGLPKCLCSPVCFTGALINAFGKGRRNSRVLPAVFRLAFICLPATSVSFFCASIKDSVACHASLDNSVFLILLMAVGLLPVALAVSSAMTSKNCFCALTKFSIPSRANSSRGARPGNSLPAL